MIFDLRGVRIEVHAGAEGNALATENNDLHIIITLELLKGAVQLLKRNVADGVANLGTVQHQLGNISLLGNGQMFVMRILVHK